MANENPASNPEDSMPDLPDTWKELNIENILIAERSLNPDETADALARRLLSENVASAVLGIIHTSKHGQNERIRTDAQKYIVERVLGRVGDDAFIEDPLTKFITEVTQFTKEEASKK